MSNTASKPNRGLVKIGKNKAVVNDLDIPALRDDYILVKVVAVALNPADWQDLSEPFDPSSKPLLIGTDFAGIVEAVGDKVTKEFKKGDRVAGLVHGINQGGNHEDGAFANFIVAKGDIAMHIPSNLTYTSAAALPSGLGTVALGLYQHLGLSLPPATVDGSEWLFVYGGSSATGSLAIQYAKLSGFKVVTTCSPHNFDYVKKLGADAVFDYRDPSCAQKIHALTENTLVKVFDTIATPTTAQISADALSSSRTNLLYVNLMGVDSPRADVKSIFFLGYTAIGESYVYDGEEWPVVPEDYELAKRFFTLAEELVAQGKIVPHTPAVRGGGLDGILSGMEDLRSGKVSGEKLVYVYGGEE